MEVTVKKNEPREMSHATSARAALRLLGLSDFKDP